MIAFLILVVFSLMALASMKYGYYTGIATSLISILLGVIELVYPIESSYFFESSHLSAIFILAVSVTFLITDLYVINRKDNYLLFFISFISIIWAISSSNSIEFLVFWELMALSGFFMIIEGNNAKKGYIYLSFSELSSVLLMIGFALNYVNTRSLLLNNFTPYALFFIFTGLMIKLGIFPYIVSEWAPISYSSVTAEKASIIAASMSALPVYFMLYSSMNIHGTNIVLILYLITGSAVTSVISAIYSAVSKNVKKALAFSSIENNSLIVIAISLFMLFYAYGLVYISFISFTSAIFLFISSIFSKSSMFLSSGNINNKQSLLFPSMNLMSLPLFAGYIGEYMLFEAIFEAIFIKNQIIFIIISIIGALVAICAGISIVTYSKLYRFMNTMEGYENSQKSIVDFGVIYGAFLLLIGIFSPFISEYIEYSVFPYGSNLPNVVTTLLSTLFVILTGTPFGGISPIFEMLFIIVFLLMFGIAFNLFKGDKRETPTWNFGSENCAYKSEGYTNAMAVNLNFLLTTNESYDKRKSEIVYSRRLSNPFWKIFVNIGNAYIDFSKWMSRNLMNGDINKYMFYIMGIFILGLVVSYLL